MDTAVTGRPDDPTPPPDTTQPSEPARLPGHQRLLRLVAALSIVGGPLCYEVGGVLSPALHTSGASSIAANATANPATNAIHLVAFVLASYLLPVGAAGLAWLAYRRTPWLATIGGLLGVIGWLPYSALTALDDLMYAMAHLPDSGAYAPLLDRFGTDPVMNGYLIVYIVAHLVAYVLFGVALRRAGAIPGWAAWSMIASSPLTIAAFVLPVSTHVAGGVAVGLLLLGSIPAARTMMNRSHCPSFM